MPLAPDQQAESREDREGRLVGGEREDLETVAWSLGGKAWRKCRTGKGSEGALSQSPGKEKQRLVKAGFVALKE